MNRGDKIESLVIVGRTYWNKTNGYTSSSAEIFANGERLITVGGCDGGSGNQFLCQAQSWLVDNAYLPERATNIEPLWQQCERLGIKLAHTSVEVKKKADL